MKIKLNGQICEVKKIHDCVYLPLLELDDGTEWYIAKDTYEAGNATKEYWHDMVENDPEELACIIGEKTLIQWGLGQLAGPGTERVCSLNEWIELTGQYPEKQWARWDGQEIEVEVISRDLADKLDFECYPGAIGAVAYRCN